MNGSFPRTYLSFFSPNYATVNGYVLSELSLETQSPRHSLSSFFPLPLFFIDFFSYRNFELTKKPHFFLSMVDIFFSILDFYHRIIGDLKRLMEL